MSNVRFLHLEMEHRRRYAIKPEMPEVREVLSSKGDYVIARDFLERIGGDKGYVARRSDELTIYSPRTGMWEGISRSELNARISVYEGYPYFDSRGCQRSLVMTARLRDGVAKCVLDNPMVVAEDFFNDAPAGVHFRNGFLLLDDGKAVLTCHSPGNKALWGMPYDYDSEAGCPRWLEFLSEVFMGDPDIAEKVKALQMYLGACVFRMAPTLQKCLVLKGEGGNGKSVLLDVVKRALFNRNCVTCITPQQWENEYYCANLLDSDINVVSEMPERDILASERFKSIVSGDEISARHPHHRAFRFCPRGGHIFAANTLPACTDDSDGYWRRFVIIEFNRRFDTMPQRRNYRELVQEMVDEAPGIMAWAIRGVEAFVSAGELVIPSSHKAVLRGWQTNTNLVASFVADCGDSGAKGSTKVKDLYSDFRVYAEMVGRRPIALNKFGERLTRLGVPREHTRTGRQYRLTIKERALWVS